jgi:hypothetical protein
MHLMKSLSAVARRLLLSSLLALCATNALPQAPAPSLYAVEIIVFRNGGEAGALPDNAPAAAAPAEDAVEVTLAPTGKLNSAAAKLRARTSGFRVLAHVAWTQAPTGWKSRKGVSATQLGLASDISGKVSFERDQYLHLGVDLTVEDGGRRYRINEMKQVKIDQIHYFDHPSVGVLAIVTRVDAPAAAAAPAAQ